MEDKSDTLDELIFSKRAEQSEKNFNKSFLKNMRLTLNNSPLSLCKTNRIVVCFPPPVAMPVPGVGE
jgi:hypothetical protein